MCVVQRGKDDSDSIKLSRKMVPKVQLKQLYLGNTCTHTCVLQLRTVTYKVQSVDYILHVHIYILVATSTIRKRNFNFLYFPEKKFTSFPYSLPFHSDLPPH